MADRAHMRALRLITVGALAGLLGAMALGSPGASAQPVCARALRAEVVALDQVFFYNRLGSLNPAGMIYALRRDVVDAASGLVEARGGVLQPGQVMLRADKRARPLVLRMNVGDCLTVEFENLLAPAPVDNEQPATRTASVHVTGMQLVGSIADDGSNVGRNASSLAAPGERRDYTFYAEREGTFLLYSTAAQTGGEGDGAAIAAGLFGAVNVEPAQSEWYRSQVTEEELRLATTGTAPSGHPIIDYDAVYPAVEPWLAEGKAGLPILRMLAGGEVVHSDLTAIITGPNRGDHVAGTYPANRVIAPHDVRAPAPGTDTRTRAEPFRELTTIFHDEVIATQAFPGLFEDPVLGFTLHSVRDGFGINYGIGGIGAQILANRLGVGPMAECVECKYEEFFLSSWTGGDPALVVDVPANVGLEALTPGATPDPAALGAKATRAFYPDDPSNVYHSYLGDHLKFRNVHAGPKEQHVFHLHAHQWLQTPDSDGSTYLDSQTLAPGSHFTYEIAYNGSGNRNQTVGDAIFHCHFYPHFAQGMWALWRIHDVFEAGTELAASQGGFHAAPFALKDGTPAGGARALPDAEITAGTPIPAVVPIPTLAMAPMPAPVHLDPADGQVVVEDTSQNPGFPFFVPGAAGHRPPHPPLDTIDDGGLPRHVVVGGTASFPAINRHDFSKTAETLEAAFIPETGTPVELAAMDFHAARTHPSFTPDGTPTSFVTNGLPPKPGAPFADACANDWATPTGEERLYKAAHIQLDITFNKVGWHFPQSRMHALWEDVADFRAGTKAPEPMFIRANSGDCVVYHLTSLIPGYYELDDFQVRTPTDITSQHIHLMKFDVLASDGGANGWNYEDGAFVPDEVVERIAAIRAFNGCLPSDTPATNPHCPVAEAHPFFGTLGAQTVVQRWSADDVLNNVGDDRTLRTVFTHDHFGPSTHQQVGLYAGLVIEPRGSVWRHPETGQLFGARPDGGPTSWRADILTADQADSYREFMLEYADFQLAYEAGGGGTWQNPVPDPGKAINPPGRQTIGLPLLVTRPDECPGGVAPPCAEAVAADDAGTFTINYRSEPLALRVMKPADPNNPSCDLYGVVHPEETGDEHTSVPVDNTGATSDCVQAPGAAGDLAYAFRSDITRAIPALNSQPDFYPPLTGGVQPGDPFTPLMRAYNGDRIQIRALIGAHEEAHIASVHGVKWLAEPSDETSGWRSAQITSISEQFNFLSPLVPSEGAVPSQMDYLWTGDSSVDGYWNGIWGLLRTYGRGQPDLLPLPNNPVPGTDSFASKIENASEFRGVCPIAAPVKSFTVFAVRAADVLPGGALVYNDRLGAYPGNPGPLTDPTAILYVRDTDLDVKLDGWTWKYTLKPGVPVEPLVLRVNAGDCIDITLRNTLPQGATADLDGYNMMPMIVEGFNANQVRPSNSVGLHAQLVATDITRHDGANVGLNRIRSQTARPQRSYRYRWYAGDISVEPDGRLVATPVEFGSVNLMPADPIKHSNKGAVGALIVEPQGATWVEDPASRLSATVTTADQATFREFVVLFQDDLNLRDGNGHAVCPVTGGAPCEGAEDAEDSGNKAINYRTEPMWFRLGYAPGAPFEATRTLDFTHALSNGITGGADPETPVFTARAGEPVRFRVLQPGGHPRIHAFQVHGHTWQRNPYVSGAVPSQTIGDNPESEYLGVEAGHGPASHLDVVLQNGAGGAFGVPGDYLLRTQAAFQFDGGIWGILRVTP